MVRAAFIVAGVLAALSLGTGAQAQSTGVAACDDFLTKYETCVTTKVPDAQRATFKGQLDQTRKMWSDMAKDANTKAALDSTCKQSATQMSAALQGFGCTF
jgi:hypothetical protein